MVTVLVGIDSVQTGVQTDDCNSSCKKGNRDPFASRSQAAFVRYVGHPKLIIQGDSEHALMAAIRDACALLAAATPRTSLVNSEGSHKAAERAVQSVEEIAGTLRLDFLVTTNIDCSGQRSADHILDGETRGMVFESFPSLDRRWKEGVRTTVRKNPTSHLCYFSLNGSCGKIRRSGLRS